MIKLEGEMQVKPPTVRGQVAERERLECVIGSQQKARQEVGCRARGDLEDEEARTRGVADRKPRARDAAHVDTNCSFSLPVVGPVRLVGKEVDSGPGHVCPLLGLTLEEGVTHSTEEIGVQGVL